MPETNGNTFLFKTIAMRTLFCFVLISATALMAAERPVPGTAQPLWPEGAPGALGEEAKDKPQITIFLPQGESVTDCAVVVCPGGGYGGLATDHEGKQIAAWFNSFGVAAFILDYRHRGKGYGHPAPLQDALRAVRTVRTRAADWGINPAKIGIMGFSAGGHLASTAGTQFTDGDPDAVDPVEKASSRPDFLILCYPVIAFGETYNHTGSMKNLLGDDPPQDLIDSYASHKRVTDKTPPTFLFHTDEDTGVPSENAVAFYAGLRRHKIPAEMHIYRVGRHGIGLGKTIIGTETWPELCRLWMINMKFI